MSTYWDIVVCVSFLYSATDWGFWFFMLSDKNDLVLWGEEGGERAKALVDSSILNKEYLAEHFPIN